MRAIQQHLEELVEVGHCRLGISGAEAESNELVCSGFPFDELVGFA